MRPELVKVLTYKSAAAVEWLQDVFNLDLTLVSRLGYVERPRVPDSPPTFLFRKLIVSILQRSLPAADAPRPRCQVPWYGHHIRSHAEARGAR